MASANLVRIKPSVIKLQKGKKKTTYYLGYPTNTWISFIVSHEHPTSGDTYISCMIDWSSPQYIDRWRMRTMQQQKKKPTCTSLPQNPATCSLSRLQNGIQRTLGLVDVVNVHQPPNQTMVMSELCSVPFSSLSRR